MMLRLHLRKGYSFQEVIGKNESLKFKHLKLKKKNSALLSKVEISLNEKDELTISYNKTKKEFKSHINTCHTKNTKIFVNHKEINEM